MTEVRKQINKELREKLNQYPTSTLIWHITCRHKFPLSLTANAALVAYIIVTQLPTAWANFVH